MAGTPILCRAAHLAVEAGADGITAHLREDRRHISDQDIARLKSELTRPLNLEMAATPEMLKIALKHVPNACCLVPERREERTTEGGLDVVGQIGNLAPVVRELKGAGIRVSLFIEPDPAHHRGFGCARRRHRRAAHGCLLRATRSRTTPAALRPKWLGFRRRPDVAAEAGLEVHAGHGLTFNTVAALARMPEVVELNIGHFLIGEAIFGGLHAAVRRMRALMDEARLSVSGRASA